MALMKTGNSVRGFMFGFPVWIAAIRDDCKKVRLLKTRASVLPSVFAGKYW